jgi:hypothetical protein
MVVVQRSLKGCVWRMDAGRERQSTLDGTGKRAAGEGCRGEFDASCEHAHSRIDLEIGC